MRRVIAIARITIRNAVRSKMVVSLLALLAAAVIGLPLTLKGDGTAEGQLRIVLGYSLGAAFGLLALTSLWAGALAVSEDVEGKQIQTVATKPVRPWEIWAGKWLGIMAINTALLALSFAATAFLLPRAGRGDEGETSSNWRSVYQPIAPIPEDRELEARALLEERIRSGAYPTNVPIDAALRAIRQELLVRSSTVAPGRRKDWRFDLPRAIERGETVRIRFHASPSQLHMAAVQGRWIAATREREVWQKPMSFIPNTVQTLDVAGAELAGARVVTISFVNEDSANNTLVFDPAEGMRLLLPAGDFAANYVRAWLLLLMRLGFLTAVGVTAGALFSVPVALFMAVSFLLTAQLAAYTAEFPAEGEGVIAFFERIGDILRVALRPLTPPPVLDWVATGTLVDSASLLRVFFVQMILYGGGITALGAGVLSRRELALPQG